MERKRILLQLRADYGFAREILRGITSRLSNGLKWDIRQTHDLRDTIDTVAGWQPDGFITVLFNPDLRPLYRRLSCPMVTLSATNDIGATPAVLVDEEAVSEMAARFFAEAGFRHVAWSGFGRARYMRYRRDCFVTASERYEMTCIARSWGPYLPTNAMDLEFSRQDAIVNWLRRLPRPCGIFAVNDEHALTLARLAIVAGLRIPDEVAILGVDDDELLCDLHDPGLSSVRTPGESIGNEAVKLLDRLMAGEDPPKRQIYLRPLGIIERASTDRSITADHQLSAALRLIDERACRGLQTENLAHHMGCSRRSLERLFQHHHLESPHARIRRRRCEEAAHLLRETTLPLIDIAMRCGYGSSARLIRAFREIYGCTPGKWRQQYG